MHHGLPPSSLRRVVAASLFLSLPLLAKPPAQNNTPTVNLPQSMVDASGNNWMVFQQGWFQTPGVNPIYGQSSQLQINGNQLGGRGGNRTRIDEKTGELLFELPHQGITVTRRVQLNKKEGYLRYIDIFRNSRPQEQSINVQFLSNLNNGINSAEIVPDPRKHDNNLACVATTDGPSCAVEIYASAGAKVTPNVEWEPGNNTITATFQLPIPTGKSVALLHIYTLSPTSDAGVNLVQSLKVSKILADVPLDIRKEIVNFVSANGMAGDFEVLRGNLLDIVELRGGDQYKGTLQIPSYRLNTFYGQIDLPADRVVGLINVGQFHPRQLLITSEGEIFGGHLTIPADTSSGNSQPATGNPSVPLLLSSGQLTQIPLSQISRIGYRKRPGEPEEWSLTKPMVLLRTGDRVQIDLPTHPVNVATRYGRLSLDPKAIASLVLAADDQAVHQIILADGSRFAGLVEADSFDMTLTGTHQPVKFPASAVSSIQFAPPQDAPVDAPTIDLTSNDKFIGTLAGQLQLDTSFDTLNIQASEIKHLAHPNPAAFDIQITLWDDSTFSGQLQQPDVPMKLSSGLTLSIPAAMIADYTQPSPTPSPATIDKIKSLAANLSAEDYKQREQAESNLLTMGSAVAPVLKDLKTTQPPEAQQRIDSILKQLEKKSK